MGKKYYVIAVDFGGLSNPDYQSIDAVIPFDSIEDAQKEAEKRNLEYLSIRFSSGHDEPECDPSWTFVKETVADKELCELNFDPFYSSYIDGYDATLLKFIADDMLKRLNYHKDEYKSLKPEVEYYPKNGIGDIPTEYELAKDIIESLEACDFSTEQLEFIAMYRDWYVYLLKHAPYQYEDDMGGEYWWHDMTPMFHEKNSWEKDVEEILAILKDGSDAVFPGGSVENNIREFVDYYKSLDS